MEQLREFDSAKFEVMAAKGYLPPTVPSDFLACHHFPRLSRMSNSSPIANEISSGSSAAPVSVLECQ